MKDNSVIFLHLSDIHFLKRSEETLDIDVELRDALEEDVKRVNSEIGGITGILVTGDIAYRGDCEEYKKALEWLEKLCDMLDLNRSHVWVIPGNHDVCRNRVKESKPIRDQHERFRTIEVQHQLHEEMQNALSDPECSRFLYRPIEEYLAFAGKFSCPIEPDKYYWQDDILLNDGSILRLRGLNSTLISDEYDNKRDKKLILGTHQVRIKQESGITYLVLCHHPPDWLLDGDEISQILNIKSKIQLFGHKHKQRQLHIKDGEQVDTLIISAGAVHPERVEIDWKPQYNFIALEVTGRNSSRVLEVLLFRRKWNNEKRKFEAVPNTNSQEYLEFSLTLPPWNGSLDSTQPLEPLMEAHSQNSSEEEKKSQPEDTQAKPVDDPARSLAYRFLTLQYHQIMNIATKLDLISDEDKGLQDFELYKNFFIKAKTKGNLDRLWELVEEEHNDGYYPSNPFKKENQEA